ncbi:MAG: 2-oxo acid dehydrogenase subunit E2, partial [Nocardioidaceae bacterium]|nr:2-oxo acid dehydrogenase subunit E2 [Nocardioidaceae bacterium]
MSDFGPNEWLVEEMYEKFRADPDSVDEAWRDLFAEDGGNGAARRTPAAPPSQDEDLPAGAKPAARSASKTDQPGSAPEPKATSPAASPAALADSAAASSAKPAQDRVATKPIPANATTKPAPKEKSAKADDSTVDAESERAVEPQKLVLRGAVARTVTNMDESLSVPTATSVRTIPVKLLIDNRVVINNHLARARGGKISFTHLVGFALGKALKAMPEMNYGYQ